MNAIEEKQREFIELYNSLADPLMQYELLLQMAGETPPPEKRDDKARIRNCQTDSWFMMRAENGRLFLQVDSDSLLIRGVLSVYVYLLDGRELEEILRTGLCFMEQTTIRRQMTDSRFSVLAQIPEMIYGFCRAHIGEENG